MNSIPETPHAYVPPTIIDKNGDVWTYSPSPLEGKFGREYTCGKRRATLMAYQGGGARRLISAWGKLLFTLRDETPSLPLTDGEVRYSTDGSEAVSITEIIEKLEAKKVAQGGKLSAYDAETLFLAYDQQEADQWQAHLNAQALERDNSEDSRRYIAAYGGKA